MKKRMVTINKNDCKCFCSLGETMFCKMKAQGLTLQKGTEVLTRITEWETQHRTTASMKSYFALYLALFRDAKEEGAIIYIPGYESILNAISIRQGKVAARETLAVMSYANTVLGVVQFPSPGLLDQLTE